MARKTKSIITDVMGSCFMCHSMRNLEIHHIFYGFGNRKLSDRYGLVVPLCHECHNEPPNGVHFNVENDLKLKQYAQIVFNIKYPDKSFTEIFGRNYIEDEDFETADSRKTF